MKVFWLPLKNDGLANPQTMAGGKVKTTSYNAPPVGTVAFTIPTKMINIIQRHSVIVSEIYGSRYGKIRKKHIMMHSQKVNLGNG
ncbi:MAG: hypothetical protein ACOY4H_02845 [Thermodesulfobacteriota bacterium]